MKAKSHNRLLAALLLPSMAGAELSINGVDDTIERNIRAFSPLAAETCETENWLIRRRFRNLEKDVRRAMQPYGFYSPTIETSLDFNDDCWSVGLAIEPGQPVLLRDVNIDINGPAGGNAEFQSLLEKSPLQKGAVLKHTEYESLKKNLQTLAADKGYVEAGFTENTIGIWPESYAADINLVMDSGPRYRIGEITQEQDFLNPGIVSAYIDFQTGDYYDGDLIAKAFRDLSESAYFSTVEVLPTTEEARDEEIPVRIRVEPGTRIEYTVGAGVSTDTGGRFRAGYRNNRVNRKGHRLISDLDVAQVIQGLSAEYRIPAGDPRREWFSITGAASSEQTDTFDNDSQSLGLRWTKAMSERWLRTLAIDFSNESFRVGTDVDTTRTVVPAVIFDSKESDRDLFPTRGRRLGVELRGTDQALGSNIAFAQALVWARWIRSFGESYRVLARFNGGYTESDNFSRLPPSLRFFAGGDESVRGFEFDSLGPKNDGGEVVGGSRLLVASIELERRLHGNFYGAVFVDAGNAFNGSDVDPEIGAGIGIKWRSPIGPIRLYLGVPVSDDEESPRLHLRLGSEL